MLHHSGKVAPPLFLGFVLCLLTACVPSAFAENWPSWRGPLDTGSLDGGEFPSALNESTMAWKTPLPGKGCSTPIVVGKSIYVTAPVEDVDALLSFDLSGGEKWVTKFDNQVPGKHRNGSGSNASPVSDGDAVFVYFKSGTLAAIETDGSIRWQTNLVERYGKDTLFWDHGTSPVLTKKHVVFARMHHGESWLAAFDKQSGDLAWKVARNYEVPKECDHGYSTPLVFDHDGTESLLVWGAEHLTVHNASDGKVTWTCGDFNPNSSALWPSIATPVVVDGHAVIAFGRNDKGSPLLFGINMKGSGDVTATNHVWMRDDISTFVPSPVAYRGNVYLVRDRGEVECIDPVSGDTVWTGRFPKSRKNFYASPLIAGGKLYAPREDGAVFVANIDDGKIDLLSENDMGESVIGSPTPLENKILIRGEEHLYCFE